jgi:hypothetical protein
VKPVLYGSCRRHRPLLAALVEHGERAPGIEAALEHLAVCAGCEEDLTGIALTVAALRRAGTTYRRLPESAPAALPPVIARPPSARPPSVRPMAPRPASAPARWAWRLQLGSLLATAAIVAVVVLPQAGLPGTVAAAHVNTPVRASGVTQWQAAEQRLASSPDTGPLAAVVTTSTLPPRYPDSLFRRWKEVPPSDATARGFAPR